MTLVRAGYEIGVEPSSRSVDVWEHRHRGERNHRKQRCELGVGGCHVVIRHSVWVLVRAGGGGRDVGRRLCANRRVLTLSEK